MKQIRKISLVIVLALVLTMGSVFAVWSYDQGSVKREGSYELHMTDIVSKGDKGRIDADNNTLKFKVDDLGEIDWKAELLPEGSVDIIFVPAANANESVQQNGIKMMVTITLSGAQTAYTAKVKDAEGKYTDASVKILTLAEDNTFVLNGGNATNQKVTISAEQIASCLVFCEGKDVYLPTYEENVRFDNAMGDYKITITITEIE
jgi:hypothetical protein